MNAVLFKQFRKICCPKIRVDNIQIDHCHLFPFRSLPQCQINRKIGFSRTIMSGNQCDSFHGMTPFFRSASMLTYSYIIAPFLKKCNCLISEILQKNRRRHFASCGGSECYKKQKNEKTNGGLLLLSLADECNHTSGGQG